jgi:hypothetical protein
MTKSLLRLIKTVHNSDGMCYCLRPRPARPDGVMFFDFSIILRLMTKLSFLPSLQKTRHPTAGGNNTYRLTVIGKFKTNPANLAK